MQYLEVSKGIIISESAYSTIVYYAVSEVEEVAISRFRRKEITERQLKQLVSIKVTDYGVEIDINVELCFGHDLEDVCKKIQDNVMDVVEQNVGYKPACVNIHVIKVSVC